MPAWGSCHQRRGAVGRERWFGYRGGRGTAVFPDARRFVRRRAAGAPCDPGGWPASEYRPAFFAAQGLLRHVEYLFTSLLSVACASENGGEATL